METPARRDTQRKSTFCELGSSSRIDSTDDDELFDILDRCLTLQDDNLIHKLKQLALTVRASVLSDMFKRFDLYSFFRPSAPAIQFLVIAISRVDSDNIEIDYDLDWITSCDKNDDELNEAIVSLLSALLLHTRSADLYTLSLLFLLDLVNDERSGPKNLGQLLYIMLLSIELADESATDLAVVVNSYLDTLREWRTWDWKTIAVSIELGLNTITYDEINSRIPENFLQACEDAYEIGRVVDLFDRMDDFKCSVHEMPIRCKRLWSELGEKNQSPKQRKDD